MTATPLPFRLDEKPLRQPRNGVSSGPQRPQWTEYRVKVPVDCDHCVLTAYERVMSGDGSYDGLRKARRKRRQGGSNLLLCSEHARIQQDQDQVDYPVGDSTGKKGRSGQRYIA